MSAAVAAMVLGVWFSISGWMPVPVLVVPDLGLSGRTRLLRLSEGVGDNFNRADGNPHTASRALQRMRVEHS
jgi:hypothetical protein